MTFRRSVSVAKKLLGALFMVSVLAMLSACSGKGDGEVCDSAVDLTSAECRDNPPMDEMNEPSEEE